MKRESSEMKASKTQKSMKRLGSIELPDDKVMQTLILAVKVIDATMARVAIRDILLKGDLREARTAVEKRKKEADEEYLDALERMEISAEEIGLDWRKLARGV